MKAFLRLVASLALSVALTFPVYAGLKLHREVVVNATSISGDIGSARNSVDNVQYIGCNDFGASIHCYGKNAAGLSKSCSSNAVSMIQQVRGLRTNTYLIISFDAQGACTSIRSYQGSFAEQSEN
jgi:hypothetical protein